METSLVVLAAGIGRRYGGLKQLEPVGPGGEALLEYSIFDALGADFERIVLVIRPETEGEFRAFLGPRFGADVPISYVYQKLSNLPDGLSPPADRNKPWGTGHAVLAVEKEIRGPFAVINADDFYGSAAFRVVQEFLNASPGGTPAEFALAGFDVGPTLSAAGPVSRGLCRADRDGWLEQIIEVLKLEKHGDGGRYTDPEDIEHRVLGSDLVSMNMWGFTPALFPELHARFREFLVTSGSGADGSTEFLLPDVVQGMIEHGKARVQVLRHDGRWCGITFPEDKERVRKFIAGLVASGEYPPRLWR